MILNKEADTKVGIPTERNQPSQLFETRHQEYLSRPESDQPFFEENQVENASPVSSGSVNEATNSVGGIFNSLLSLQCAGSDENQGSSSVGGSPDDTARGGSCRLGLGGAHSVQLCGGCGDAIVDKYLMNVLDKAWHASCVRCCDCNSPLTDKCYSRDGRLFCKEDFFRRFSTKCFGCNEPIMPKELLRKVRKHYFHLGCFVCSLCSKQLATGDELYVTPDNKLICRQDFLTASSTSVSSTSATLSLSLSPSSPPELTGDQENQTRKEAETCSSISEYPNQTFQDSNTTQKLEKTPPVKLEGPNSDLSLESKQQCEFEQNDTFPQNSLPFCQSFMKEKPVSKAACNFKSSDKSSVTGDDKGKCCEATLKSDLFKNDSSNCEIMHQNLGGESNGVLEDYTSDTGGFNSDDDEKMFDDQDEGADLSDDNKSDFDESEFKNCGSPNKMNGETEDEIIGNPKTKSQVGSKRRGPRTTIKAKQLETLKSAFAATPKPTRHIREQLAQETGLNMRVIQVWFQNRRSKERRMKQLSALGARRAAFFQRRIRGPFEGPHNPDFLPGQIPFFGPQDLGNPDFFPMGQQFSYDFFPGVHQLGQPPTPLGVDNNEFPMPGNLPTPSSVMDPLRLHPDQLGVGMGGPFIPTSAPPPPLGSNNPVPISSAEEALAAMNSSQTGNHRLVLPSPDLNLPPSDRFLSSLTKPRFRHVFEDSPAPVW